MTILMLISNFNFFFNIVKFLDFSVIFNQTTNFSLQLYNQTFVISYDSVKDNFPIFLSIVTFYAIYTFFFAITAIRGIEINNRPEESKLFQIFVYILLLITIINIIIIIQYLIGDFKKTGINDFLTIDSAILFLYILTFLTMIAYRFSLKNYSDYEQFNKMFHGIDELETTIWLKCQRFFFQNLSMMQGFLYIISIIWTFYGIFLGFNVLSIIFIVSVLLFINWSLGITLNTPSLKYDIILKSKKTISNVFVLFETKEET